MSTRWAPLTLRNLVNALAKVPDWREVGVQLDVDYATLDQIEQDCSKVETKKSRMLHTWMSNADSATWEDVVTALKNMNLNNIARRVQAKYCHSPQEQNTQHSDFSPVTSLVATPTPSPLVAGTDSVPEVAPPPPMAASQISPPLTTEGMPTSMDFEDSGEEDRLQVVEEEIGELDRKFRNLVLNAGEYLTKKESTPGFLSKFRINLVHPPAPQVQQHVEFFDMKRKDLISATSVEEVFLILGCYWNWWNYSLLQHVIESFGSQQLKDELHCYLKDLEEFEKDTIVEDFICACHSYLGVPPEFTEVRTRMKGDWTRYTIYQIRKLARKLARKIARSSPFVGMSHSSIVLIWAVPSTVVHVLAAAIDEEFLQSNEIESVTIDGKDLSSYQSQDRQPETPSKPVDPQELHKACEEGNVELTLDLLDAGVDVETRDTRYRNERTPLMTACRHGRLDIVHLLLCFNADVNAREKDGWTPLIWACMNGHVTIVHTLVEAHADLNAHSNVGWTALSLASIRGHTEAVRAILMAGAEVDAQPEPRGMTALMKASESGHSSIVRELLDGGASVNLQDNSGRTALFHACWRGKTEVVRELLQRQADVNIPSEEGLTPLIIATREGYTEVVELLLSSGKVDTEIQEQSGRTALTYASGHQAVVDILKDKGAVNPESDKEGTQQRRSKRRTLRKQTTQRSHSAADLPVRRAYSLADLTATPRALSDSSVSSGDEHHSPPRYWSAAEHSAGSSAGSTCSLGGRYSPTPQVRTKRKYASRRKRFGYSPPPSPPLY